MKKIKKQLLIVLSVLCCVVLAIGLTACGKTEAPKDGKSAIDLWLELPENSGKTSEDFWKELKGEKGDKGDKGDNGAQGEPGKDGVDGKSAYEIWKGLEGNADKTEAEFIEALKGAAGNDGVGIKTVAVEDNQFVITLTNDTVVKVNISGIKNTCAHAKAESVVIQHHGRDAAGNVLDEVTLEVCSDCGASKLIRNKEAHDWKVAEEGKVFIVEPTCTEKGFQATKWCRLCHSYEGKVEGTEKPALGHDYESAIIIDEGKHICETDYMTADRCNRCGDIKAGTVESHERAEHTFEGEQPWKKDVEPDVKNIVKENGKDVDKGEGRLYAHCSTCNEDIDKPLPSFEKDGDNADYKIEGDLFGCGAAREVKITYLGVSYKNEKGEDVHYITYTKKIAKKDHTVTLADGSKNKIDAASASTVIKVSDADIKSATNPDGKIELFANSVKTCKTEGTSALVYCDECGARLTCNVRFEHTPADESVLTKVTYRNIDNDKDYCSEEGETERFTCKICHETNVTIKSAPLKHSLKLVFIEEKVKAGEKVTYTVKYVCQNTAKDNKLERDCKYSRTICNGATKELVSEIPATCTKEGKRVYKIVGKVDGVEKTFDNVEETIPMLKHFVTVGEGDNAKKVEPEATINYDDFVAKYGKGIIEFSANQPETSLKCNNSVTAIYTCKGCSRPVFVTLTRGHEMKVYEEGENKGKPVYEKPVAATCTTPAGKEYICKNCTEHYTVYEGEALGHDFEYNAADKTAVCKRESCGLKLKDVTFTITPATCDHGTYFNYKGTEVKEDGSAGQVLSFRKEVSDPVHTIDDEEHPIYTLDKNGATVYVQDEKGELVKVEEVYDLDEAKGITIFANSKVTCGDPKGAEGMYTCTKCGKPVIIKVKVPHSFDESKTKPEDMENKDATCTEAGHVWKYCINEKTWIKVPVAALGHKVVATPEINGLGEISVTEKCVREGCKADPITTKVGTVQYEKVVVDGKETYKLTSVSEGANVAIKNVAMPTCLADGAITFAFSYTSEWTKKGNGTCDVLLKKVDHNHANKPKYWTDPLGKYYEGWYCDMCKQYYIKEVKKTDVDLAGEPVAVIPPKAETPAEGDAA